MVRMVPGVARLELGSKWMCKEIFLYAPVACFQGIIENQLEVREGGEWRVSVRHSGSGGGCFFVVLYEGNSG